MEEFEYLLNDASYMLSNLDLNGDGYVDYLRVMETIKGRAQGLRQTEGRAALSAEVPTQADRYADRI